MRSLTNLFIAVFMLLALPVYAESELGVLVSSDVVAFNYGRNNDNNSQWGMMGLYNDSEHASLIAAHFNVVGDVGDSSEFHTGLGFKAAVYDTFETAASLALGGRVEYSPVNGSGVGLIGQLYYAPNIFSTKDVSKYLDIVLRLTYAVNPQAKVFVGWQNIEVGYDEIGSDFKIDQSLNVGFSLYF